MISHRPQPPKTRPGLPHQHLNDDPQQLNRQAPSSSRAGDFSGTGGVQAVARTSVFEVINIKKSGEANTLAPAFQALKGRAEAIHVVLTCL